MSRDTDAPPKRGIVHVRERAVHWVLGRCDAPRRELTHIAERWVEDMVTRELGLRWRGIDRGSGGEKPRLRGLDADFSVSHSGDVLLVAVGAGDGIGADVEAAPAGKAREPADRGHHKEQVCTHRAHCSGPRSARMAP